MKFIKEYEVTTTGKSQGLDVPAGHRILVTMACVRVKKHPKSGDESFELHMDVLTYKDNTYAQRVENDMFPLNRAIVDLGSNLPTGGIKTIVKNEMNKLLDAGVGSGNYTEEPA